MLLLALLNATLQSSKIQQSEARQSIQVVIIEEMDRVYRTDDTYARRRRYQCTSVKVFILFFTKFPRGGFYLDYQDVVWLTEKCKRHFEILIFGEDISGLLTPQDIPCSKIYFDARFYYGKTTIFSYVKIEEKLIKRAPHETTTMAYRQIMIMDHDRWLLAYRQTSNTALLM